MEGESQREGAGLGKEYAVILSSVGERHMLVEWVMRENQTQHSHSAAVWGAALANLASLLLKSSMTYTPAAPSASAKKVNA
jgi:hypothetical protein